MLIRTTRFGNVEIEPDDTLQFPEGLIGMEDCVDWVLLADAENDALGWLQCTSRPETALAVVSPRRFVPDYQIRLAKAELGLLRLDDPRQAQVLAVVGRNQRALTINLKAPIAINLDLRLGRQVIAGGDLPLQHELRPLAASLRKSA